MSEQEAARNGFKVDDYINLPKTTLGKPVLFQVMDIIDITASKLSQLDDWKAIHDPLSVAADRTKTAKRNQARQRIITQVNLDSNPDETPNNSEDTFDIRPGSNAIFKLTLKDEFSNYCFAIEYQRLSFLHSGGGIGLLPIRLGAKLIAMSGTLVQYGVLMLVPSVVRFLGGESRELNDNVVEKYITSLETGLKDQVER